MLRFYSSKVRGSFALLILLVSTAVSIRAAQIQPTEALMQEVRHDGIKVSYICPGSVNTYFGGDTPTDAKAWQLQPEDIAQIVMDLLAMDPRALPSKVEIRPSRPPKA